MRIKTIVEQHRRDFTAIYQCEHCGHEHKGYGYDDAHFHRDVIPNMKCSACENTAAENYRPLEPKHPESAVV